MDYSASWEWVAKQAKPLTLVNLVARSHWLIPFSSSTLWNTPLMFCLPLFCWVTGLLGSSLYPVSLWPACYSTDFVQSVNSSSETTILTPSHITICSLQNISGAPISPAINLCLFQPVFNCPRIWSFPTVVISIIPKNRYLLFLSEDKYPVRACHSSSSVIKFLIFNPPRLNSSALRPPAIPSTSPHSIISFSCLITTLVQLL